MIRATNREEERTCTGCGEQGRDQAVVIFGDLVFSACVKCQSRLGWWLTKVRRQRGKEEAG